MKRYTDPEMEVVSFEIEDVTNNSRGDNEVSGGEDSPIWGDTVNW